MSEYWKSTPKYWCKHCKTFVKDTKLEKTNHEATPKHQGNIKRFIRDLHRGHEKDDREKQRAKDEVERLNGVVSGASSAASGSGDPPWKWKSAIPPSSSGPRQATPADRKAQLAQLAAMGVAVPEDFRREMAMVGDWQTLSTTPIYENVKEEDGEDAKDIKPSLATGENKPINIGVRKRKFEGQEEEEEAGARVVRKGWGSTFKTYPGGSGDVDLDALLNNTNASSSTRSAPGDKQGDAQQSTAEHQPTSATVEAETANPTTSNPPLIKREESATSNVLLGMSSPTDDLNPAVKQEDGALAGGIVFKKRKAKPIKQK